MIKKLLKIEFIKNFNYINFWVMAGLWVLLFALVVFIVTQINIGAPGLESKPYLQFPSVWTTIAWVASWFNLILAIIMIVTVGNEFSYRTFRSQVICGLSRNHLILGKGLFIMVMAFASMLIVLLFTVIFGCIFTSFGTETSIFQKSYTLFVYFIQSIGYMSLGMMIAILLKNTALSIVTFILYFFPAEPIIRNILPDPAFLYFPMKVISNLTPPPDIFHGSFTTAHMSTSINGQVVQQAPPPVAELSLSMNVTLAVVYIILFFAVSSLTVNKRNL
jgi:ABC-2 type transport system permease protein